MEIYTKMIYFAIIEYHLIQNQNETLNWLDAHSIQVIWLKYPLKNKSDSEVYRHINQTRKVIHSY